MLIFLAIPQLPSAIGLAWFWYPILTHRSIDLVFTGAILTFWGFPIGSIAALSFLGTRVRKAACAVLILQCVCFALFAVRIVILLASVAGSTGGSGYGP